jgi:hypothetical protein
LENFSLWNLSEDRRARRVTFYATSLGLQQINRGTRGMLHEMLGDLGFPSLDIDDWAVSHAATDYLSDFRDSDDWRDRWLDTWTVEVHLKDAVELPERRRQTPTLASDKTWKGDEPAPNSALIVADFPDDEKLARMQATLTALGRSHGLTEAELAEAAPTISGQQVRQLLDELKSRSQDRDAGPLSFRLSPATEHQLHVLVPANKAFFERGARLALLIESLAEQLGGTTYWRDTVTRRANREE